MTEHPSSADMDGLRAEIVRLIMSGKYKEADELFKSRKDDIDAMEDLMLRSRFYNNQGNNNLLWIDQIFQENDSNLTSEISQKVSGFQKEAEDFFRQAVEDARKLAEIDKSEEVKEWLDTVSSNKIAVQDSRFRGLLKFTSNDLPLIRFMREEAESAVQKLESEFGGAGNSDHVQAAFYTTAGNIYTTVGEAFMGAKDEENAEVAFKKSRYHYARAYRIDEKADRKYGMLIGLSNLFDTYVESTHSEAKDLAIRFLPITNNKFPWTIEGLKEAGFPEEIILEKDLITLYEETIDDHLWDSLEGNIKRIQRLEKQGRLDAKASQRLQARLQKILEERKD